MKKIAISGLFILVFVAYVLSEKFVTNKVDIAVQTETPTLTNSQVNNVNSYKDGEYTSSVGDAFFGPLQIKLIITGGKISDVVFLKYPDDRPTSIQINEDAMPILKQEAIAAQSDNVDIVTGATQTAEAFQLLLKETLGKAS